MTTKQQISEAVAKGANWLIKQQNADGSFGMQGLNSTCLALYALSQCKLPGSGRAMTKAFSYLLKSKHSLLNNLMNSFTTLALISVKNKTPAVQSRIQTQVTKLAEAQGKNPKQSTAYGGWGSSTSPDTADGTNTEYALQALYAAAVEGFEVPADTWQRAIEWYWQNYKIHSNGRFVYQLEYNDKYDREQVNYSMTAGALSGLRIISSQTQDHDTKARAQKLLQRTLSWLDDNYTVELSIVDNWQYYYLSSLARGCSLKPQSELIPKYQWLDNIAAYLIKNQQAEGRWVSHKRTQLSTTAFALLALVCAQKSAAVENIQPIAAEKVPEKIVENADAKNANLKKENKNTPKKVMRTINYQVIAMEGCKVCFRSR